MNKKVLRAGICLCLMMLLTVTALKFIFPRFVIEVATTPNIIRVGEWIDGSIIGFIAFDFVIGLFAGFLFFCSCMSKKSLNKKELIIFVSCTLALAVCTLLGTTIHFILTAIIMYVVLPIIFKINWKRTVLIVSLIFIVQGLILLSRDITLFIATTNSATAIILTIDAYIFYTLLYLYSNYKQKEVKENGTNMVSPIWRQEESDCFVKTSNQRN